MSATQEPVSPVQSGAAGAATFAGSDSRKYNYFEPKGRKASHYEDMTVDVQPDPKRYLLQDWIISFADGTPTYSEEWTAAKSSNWHVFRAVDQEWERTHYQRQSTIVGMIASVVENGRRAGAVKRHFDRQHVWVLRRPPEKGQHRSERLVRVMQKDIGLANGVERVDELAQLVRYA